MDKLNAKLIGECNNRIAEKESVYGGKDNPKNYRNMYDIDLWELVGVDFDKLGDFLDDETPIIMTTDEAQIIIIDMINRLGMIWQKREDDK